MEEDKGIKKEDIIEAVTESRSASSPSLWTIRNAAIEFNEKLEISVFITVREVVDEVFDSRLEISLKDALAISSAMSWG